ncbi:B12-binding domain-containing protein [Nocardioides sp. CFH 31398]|uniref:cobalamin B12-binding domain-containing protein n=1 Tax=Nocardioides sp. CFH 31398 TaxID=2919579 RepID=UPI001F054381|nr:cobalamin-dependent protein [Nocardioides sp. CFH 31398]MCH1868795.1 cobalamin-dependent protein [Nocardioides sp. CFH 31398]
MDAEYWQALCDGDRHASLAAVRRLRASGLTAAQIVADHVVPAQRLIGDLWLAGEWTVAEEHAATAISEGVVHWLGSFSDPPSSDRPLVLVSCLEKEQHALPALIVSEALVEAGYRVNYLGGSPDPDDLVLQVVRLRPRAVLFSGSLTSSLGRQKRLMAQIGTLGLPVIVGGAGFGSDGSRAEALGATAWCASPAHAVELLRTLPERTERLRMPEPTMADEEAAWIEEHRAQIAGYVVAGLRDADHFSDELARSARGWLAELEGLADHLVGCLSAALVTGDETIMVEAHSWLAQVLVARDVDTVLLVEAWSLLAESLRGHPLARAAVASAASFAEQSVSDDAEPGASGRGAADTQRASSSGSGPSDADEDARNDPV